MSEAVLANVFQNSSSSTRGARAEAVFRGAETLPNRPSI